MKVLFVGYDIMDVNTYFYILLTLHLVMILGKGKGKGLLQQAEVA